MYKYTNYFKIYIHQGFPGCASGKEFTASAGDTGDMGFDPWVRKIHWRRKWQPTPVFLVWKILWTEEPGRLQAMELQRVGHD